MSRIVILGAAGLAGSWTVRHFARPADDVITVDRVGNVDHRGDVRSPNPKVRAAVVGADVVVLALPEDVVIDCLVWLGAAAPPTTLLVTTCSVQRPVFDLAAATGVHQPLIGVDPLFSPSLPVVGRPVAVVCTRHGAEVRAVCARLEEAEMRPAILTPDEHDAALSYLQVLPHAAVLAFAEVLAAAPLDLDRLLDLAPPPARVLLALAARILTAPPEVYWDIQHANAEASARRKELADALAGLSERVAESRVEEFKAVLATIADRLGRHLVTGADTCRQLFEHMDRP